RPAAEDRDGDPRENTHAATAAQKRKHAPNQAETKKDDTPKPDAKKDDPPKPDAKKDEAPKPEAKKAEAPPAAALPPIPPEVEAKLEAARRAVAEAIVAAQDAGLVQTTIDPPPILDILVTGRATDRQPLKPRTG